MAHLSYRLKFLTGKKQYGYLKAPLKSVVDEIVDELTKDPRVAEAYRLWYDLREDVLRTYKGDLPARLPLSQQKEFKQIKNIIIREAERLPDQAEVFAPQERAADDPPSAESVGDDEPLPDAAPDDEQVPEAEPRLVLSKEDFVRLLSCKMILVTEIAPP